MENARNIRKALGLSQGAMAEKLGITQGALCRIEKKEEGQDRRIRYACLYLLIRAILDENPALAKSVDAKVRKAFKKVQ